MQQWIGIQIGDVVTTTKGVHLSILCTTTVSSMLSTSRIRPPLAKCHYDPYWPIAATARARTRHLPTLPALSATLATTTAALPRVGFLASASSVGGKVFGKKDQLWRISCRGIKLSRQCYATSLKKPSPNQASLRKLVREDLKAHHAPDHGQTKATMVTSRKRDKVAGVASQSDSTMQKKTKKKMDSRKNPGSSSSSPLPSPESSSQTTTGLTSSPPTPLNPTQELDQLQLLVDQLLTTNSTLAKRSILGQHEQRAPILAWIYDPLRQFHIRSTQLIKYAEKRATRLDSDIARQASILSSNSNTTDSGVEESQGMSRAQTELAKARADSVGQGFDSLPDLLSALSRRSVSGHTAKDAILLFMERFCGPVGQSPSLGQKSDQSHLEAIRTLLSTPRSKLLMKCLDKNLKTGCSLGLIREVFPNLLPGFHVALGHSLLHLEEARTFFSAVQRSSPPPPPSSPAEPKTEAAGWYGSRKLDGVRCLVRIDCLSGEVETLSRTGRFYESLGDIQEAIQALMGKDESSRRKFFQKALEDPKAGSKRHKGSKGRRRASGMVKASGGTIGVEDGQDEDEDEDDDETYVLPQAMYWDGEICMFSGDTTGAVLGDEDDLWGKEDFTSTLRIVKRALADVEGGSVVKKEDDVAAAVKTRGADLKAEGQQPLYCIFDCLTEQEFQERVGFRSFSERIGSLLRALPVTPSGIKGRSKLKGTVEVGTSAKSLDKMAQMEASKRIRVLNQTKVESFEQLEEMVTRGMDRGWEGVMLRKDVGYEGKRSRNLLKIKQFQEAEFVVQEVMVGKMRFGHEGQVKERDGVLTSVVVYHRGNKVRVGSGFTAEDRVRFGKDPSLIVGKTITVQYFEESKTIGNSSSSPSPVVAGDDGFQKKDGVLEQEVDCGDRGHSSEQDQDGAVWSLRFPTVKAIYDHGPRQL